MTYYDYMRAEERDEKIASSEDMSPIFCDVPDDFPREDTDCGKPAECRCGRCPRHCLCAGDVFDPAKHYHHYKGYDPEHWLDVEPLCLSCHQKEHWNG